MSIVDFANSDLLNVKDITCNSISATGYIGSLLHCGVTSYNVTVTPTSYFDPWEEAVVKKGINYSKFSEYLEWRSDVGVTVGTKTSGWVILKPCLISYDLNATSVDTGGDELQVSMRKYNSSLSIDYSIPGNATYSSTMDQISSNISQIDYFDVGDILFILYRNKGAPTTQFSLSIHLIKDGTNINYTTE